MEHPLRVIKRQFGYTKVRYRRLAKNSAQLLTLFAPSNLWMTRRQFVPAQGSICLEVPNGAFKTPLSSKSRVAGGRGMSSPYRSSAKGDLLRSSPSKGIPDAAQHSKSQLLEMPAACRVGGAGDPLVKAKSLQPNSAEFSVGLAYFDEFECNLRLAFALRFSLTA